MNPFLAKNWLAFFVIPGLLAGTVRKAQADCTVCDGGEEQTVEFHLRGAAQMAGSATVTITTESGTTDPITVQMNADPSTIVYSPSQGRYVVDHYECVQWNQDYVVDVKLDEPILITITFDSNPLDPSYTEFESVGEFNPIIYYSRPSLTCLHLFFDDNDQTDQSWMPETPVFVTFSNQIRMKPVLGNDDTSIGDALGGIICDAGEPAADDSALMDSTSISAEDAPCPTSGGSPLLLQSIRKSLSVGTDASAATTNSSRGKVRPGFRVLQPQFDVSLLRTNSALADSPKQRSGSARTAEEVRSRLPNEREVVKSIKGHSAKSGEFHRDVGQPRSQLFHLMTSSAAGPNSPPSASPRKSATRAAQSASSLLSGQGSGPNGYTVATQIGRLRWEMSLGSAGRMHSFGKLIYQTDVIDSNAYSPARLSLTSGGDRSSVLTGSDGSLQTIGVGGNLVSILPLTNGTGFVVSVYTNGVAALTWTVQNPDPTPQGRITFTKVQGTNTEFHLAQWQGTNGVAGTMTISRYGGKWTEVRNFLLNSNATQRIETISEYKGATLQHKSIEVHQQFYNWGNPGDIFEALVQRVEDPDNQALTTSFIYWDKTNEPGNLLFQATYPDGYSEQVPFRASGNGFSPVVSSGGALQTLQPFKDLDPTNSAARAVNTYYNQISSQQVTEETVTSIGGFTVSDQFITHTFTNGFWIKQISDLTDPAGFAYQEEWSDIQTRRQVFLLDRDGKTQNIFYDSGFWDTSSLQFVSFPSSTTVPAIKTTTIHGSDLQQNGIANQTTVDVSIEDSFGHVVEEDSSVSDGNGGTLGLIDQKLNAYADGRLTASYQNGRLTFQANYDSEGNMLWQEDESGRHTDFAYDEMKRVVQRIIRGRGGDADQVCTYDYDVFGNKISDVTVAGGLTNQVHWIYDLAGQMIAAVGTDGLTNFINTSYANGYKTVTQTLPTQGTRIASFYKDRGPRSLTGTAVEAEYYLPFIFFSSPNSFLVNGVYRDSGFSQLKQLSMANWVGNEILFQTPQFQAGYRTRYTDYDFDVNGQSRQLVMDIRESGRTTQLFTYDELGQMTGQGLDIGGNGVLDPASLDQMTTYARGFTNDLGMWQAISTVQRFLQDSNATPTLVQRTRATVPAALGTAMLASNVMERVGSGAAFATITLNRATGEVTTTNDDLELGQVSVNVQRDGLLRSETPSGIATRSYSYTALGELQVINDTVTGNVTNAYDTVTRRLASVADGLGQTTTYDYYPAGATNAGRIHGIQDSGGNWAYFDYTLAGQLFRKWGVNTYPVQQQYDQALRLTNLMTFRTSGGAVNWASPTWPSPPSGDTTRWIYDQPSGLLAQKLYADNKGVSYLYDAGNFLITKTNGRGQTISYTVDGAGLLRNVVYSDNSPSVTIDYDRAGRPRSVVDASGTHVTSWTDRDQLGNETYTNGLLTGITITRGYDTQFRPATLGLTLGGVPTLLQRTTYDPKSWVDYITDETPDGSTVLHKFDYTFAPGTPFVQSVDFYGGGNAVMTQSYTRDSLGRVVGAGTSLAGGSTVNNVNYQFDNLNRRKEADLADGSKWTYGYDNRSQVTSGKRQLGSGQFAGGEQFEYNYDDIGNRTSTRSGGDASGSNLRSASYSANSLNQYTSRDVPGSVWITGEAPTNMTLQGIAAYEPFGIQRQDGQRFFGEAPISNALAAAYARITVAGETNGFLNDVETGHQFLSQTPESFAYDADGNLIQDGRWNYTWDAENRLVNMTARTQVPDAAKRKLDFLYDAQGRRVQKIVSLWNPSTLNYQPSTTNLFAYDRWNLVATLDGRSSLLQSFSWGLDLSGTTQGAGGAGGLLSMTITGTNSGSYFYGFDGNGNVVIVVNAANSGTAAQFEYGPSAEMLSACGTLVNSVPFRFGTKYYDSETECYYYGFRYLKNGRWLSRDPIEELGGNNLYAFAANDPENKIDLLGKDTNLPPGGNAFDPWPYSHNDWPTVLGPPPTPQDPSVDWNGFLESFILDQASAFAQISSGFSFPAGPAVVSVTMSGQFSAFRCIDEQGHERKMFKAEGSLEVKGGVGFGLSVPKYPTPKGRDRNKLGPDGQKLKDLAGQTLPWYDQMKKVKGTGGAQFARSKNGCNLCPKEGWKGTVQLGIGAEVGVVLMLDGKAYLEWQMQRSFSWKDVQGKIKGTVSIKPSAVAQIYIFGKGTVSWTHYIE